MARLYGDENFDVHAIELLRQLGHDALTVRDAGKGNQSTPDHEVLAYATENNRAVVTFDRRDYFRYIMQMLLMVELWPVLMMQIVRVWRRGFMKVLKRKRVIWEVSS